MRTILVAPEARRPTCQSMLDVLKSDLEQGKWRFWRSAERFQGGRVENGLQEQLKQSSFSARKRAMDGGVSLAMC